MAPVSSSAGVSNGHGRSHLKIALVLGGASGLGAALVVPYLATLFPELRELEISLWVVAAASALQNGLLATGLAWAGLTLGRGLDLGAPHLQHWLSERETSTTTTRPGWAGMGTSILLAVVVAAVVVAVDAFLLLPSLSPIRDIPTPGPFTGLLASFYGGIAEEVIVRLFAMTTIVWLLAKANVRMAVSAPIAIALAAALFGVLHLPTAFQLFEPSTMLIFRTVLLNMALGIPFGWIYWKRGLEQAMVAHFAADLILHVVTPLLFG